MTIRHWSDDELIGRLYGVGPEDGHLEVCMECGRRWQALLQVRGQVLATPPISEQFLLDQRRAIRSRLASDRPRPGWLRVAPAAVIAAGVILLAVVLYRPVPAPRSEVDVSDSELYADVYAMVQSDEPLAVQPMHALFEAQQ